MTITMIIMRPENPGNTGAICRAMKNFGFKDLVLIAPSFDIENDELRNRAKWANDIVDDITIQRYDMKHLRRQFDYLIATTAKLGRDYNIARSPITPEQLAQQISGKSSRIGIIIGRESSGLTNAEIRVCDYTVTIPTSRKYGTMNMSHAATVIMYELFKREADNIIAHIKPISQIEKQQLLKMVYKALANMKFTTPSKKQTQKILWKKLIGKSYLSKREAYALMGFLKKIK